MLARVDTFAIDGIEPRRVWVEVDIRAGLPAFTVVGLADAAVREARERVRAALLNSGFEFPARRITVNLAPAHLRKAGAGFDLALGAGILAASGQLPAGRLEGWAVFGELGLGGELRGCRGTLAVAEGARRAGLHGLVLPRERAGEAALIEGLTVAGAETLRGVRDLLAGSVAPAPPPPPPPNTPVGNPLDLADVRGQSHAVRALEVAAAGGHHLLMEGPPGGGKTMLARRLPSILPALTRAEALEVTRIHSVAGLHAGAGLVPGRPFRAPHHTISAAGLVGGGVGPAPGEASLAHRGVLFLDELGEFARPGLEALRQPLEEGEVTIVRSQRSARFPARFQLVAATNPCPCGMAGLDDRCRCSETDVARYRRRLSGPLLDRMDLLIDVGRPVAAELERPGVRSAPIRDRVQDARERQCRRYGNAVTGNATASIAAVAASPAPAPRALAALGDAYRQGQISGRGRDRALRVARTIADLDRRAAIGAQDVLLDLGYRQRTVTP